MERTMTLAIFVCFAIVGAALIFLFVAQSAPKVRNGFCAPDPLCGTKASGEAFCDNGELVTCTLNEEGCLKPVRQLCVCVEQNQTARCP
jgi:hypothetical protein